MKRILSLTLVLVLSLCLFACDDEPIGPMSPEAAIQYSKDTMSTLSNQAADRDKLREDLINKNMVKVKGNVKFSLPGADIKLNGYSVIPWNSFGTDHMQIYFLYDFTNTREEDSYCSSVQVVAYQDGVRLDVAPYIDDNATAMIKNGVTIALKEAFVLNNLESDVQIKFEAGGEESAEYTAKIR